MDGKLVKKYNQIITDAIVDLLFDYPLFGQIAMNVGGLKLSNDFGAVARTDGNGIYINPEYAEEQFTGKMNKQFVEMLIAHEVSHILLKTISREKANKFEHELSNIAHDYIINQMLVDDEQILRSSNVGRETVKDTGLYEPETFRDMSYEEAYRYLKSRKDYLKSTVDQWKDQWIKDQEAKQEKNYPMDWDHEDVLKNLIIKEEMEKDFQKNLNKDFDMSDEDVREIEQRAEGLVQSIGVGKASDLLKRLIKEIPVVKENWRDHLDQYIQSFSKVKPSWKLPNKRFFCGGDPKFGGVYLPRKNKTPELNILVGLDTSGSISQRMLEEFFGHLTKVMDSYKTFNIKVFCWSTKVHKDTIVDLDQDNYYNFDPLNDYVQSYGGTVISPTIEYIREVSEDTKVDAAIIFTDGEFYTYDLETFDECPVLFAIQGRDNKDFVAPKAILQSEVIYIED